MTQTLNQTSSKSLTFDEYRIYQSNDDTLYELFRGQLIPMPTPTDLHNRICEYLVYILKNYFARNNINLLTSTTTGVRTEINSSRIPDIVVASRELWQIMSNRKGAAIFDLGEVPRLVIEVTSQNWRDDYVRKMAEYALIDIPEYWIIDPQQEVVLVCHNPKNKYGYETQEFTLGQNFNSCQFPDLVLSVNEVIAPPLVEDLIQQEQLEKQKLEAKLARLTAKLQALNIDIDDES
jgi:Uma2 family endonuclease